MFILAEVFQLDGGTAVSVVMVGAILGAALKVRSWITDEKDARVAADHRLELMITELAKACPTESGIHQGPAL